MRLPLKIQARGPLFKSLVFNGDSSSPIRFFGASSASCSMREEAQPPTAYSNLISAFQYCKTHRLLSVGKMAHGVVLRSGLELDLYLSNNLLSVYMSSSAITDARQVFGRMLVKDSVSWNTMTSGFVNLGFFFDGFSLFCEIIRVGILPTRPSFASVLVACAQMGNSMYIQQVHGFIIKFGSSSDLFVGNSLLKGYIDLGEEDDWEKLLNEMCVLDEISIEILLRGCVCQEKFYSAVELFKYSCSVGLSIRPYAITSLLSLCSIDCRTILGFQIHGFVQKVGLDMDVSVVNSLITLYSRSCNLFDAENLFEWSCSRDIISWNSLINGYAFNGEGDAGLVVVLRLICSGTMMNESTFLSFLSCCATIYDLQNAKQAHVLILKLIDGYEELVENVILTMYTRCQSIEGAVSSFKAIKIKDSLSSNLMMGFYRSCGRHRDAIKLFQMTQSQGSQMDELMFSGVLSSCSRLGLLDFGCQIHGCIIKNGFDTLSHIKNSILELYSQCGRVEDMERVFEFSEKNDLFSWNMMLIGYANHELFHKALSTWREMVNLGIKLNEFSYSALLDACSHTEFLFIGEQIHTIIQKIGLNFDTALLNSLLTFYSNCGKKGEAHFLFEEIPSPDSVSWNAMVSAYTQNGFPKESIKLFIKMNRIGVETNEMTYGSLLSSCSMLIELNLGLQLHAQAIKRAFDSNLPVSNSLITMYAKCGDIQLSSQIFWRTQKRDLITWNSMICAYAHHGLGKEAIIIFKQMKYLHLTPNSATFIGVLSACSRAGLVSEACYYFKIMAEVYGIVPEEEHCACFVDALCRAGKLKDAKLFIESNSIKNCSLVWKTLLSFCRANGDVKLAEMAAKKTIDLEPLDSASYVMLSDLYASMGNRALKDWLRRLMDNRGVKKVAASSWISTVSYVSLKQRVSDCVFPFPFPFSPCALQWLILLLACVFLTKAIGQPNNMSNFGGRTDTWSSDSSQAEAATDKVASWKNLGTSMNAISFGFVATAILISMFLIMAILERLIRPRQSAGRSQNGGEISANLNHQQAQLQEMGKLSNSKSQMLARPPSDFSVLMPGQQYPTFLAQPAPLLPCAREEIFWPSHDHHSFDFP
ncbi:Pentatricopeptide repeat-containing protein [Apostasia shenzhenica]|uniref:Pentatricopeptide repeat-containing protein n=1 Tax=Apostasia shenzhenica TaxID=1088818 RepID=A0A2I0AKI6_9ASPA|nr:Pentatricopeptide repeat-containing protein [Apostasia shenzhenica]